MPTGYLLILYWTIAALGAAMFLGTGAALVRSVRTGSVPGRSRDGGALDRLPRRRVVVRTLLGLAVMIAGLVGVWSVGGSGV